MKILVLGGDGMLGHQLLSSFRDRHDVRVTLRQPLAAYAAHGVFTAGNSVDQVDVLDLDRVRSAFDRTEPAARYRRRIVMSTHPRTKQRLTARWRTHARPAAIEFLPPFGFFEWIKLQTHAFCVLSDSGTLSEEAALLRFPAVMLRDTHERPEAMEAGVTVLGGVSPTRVLQAVRMATSQAAAAIGDIAVPDYAARDVSRTVVRIVLSYVDYVRRTTWYESAR